MARSTASCLQLLTVGGLFCIVTGQEVIRRELHACYISGQEILLNCTSSHMILVESAVIGTSDGWTAGTINCTRNNENCVKRIQQPHEECNYKSTCSLPQNIINQNIGNGCLPTNYINIIYVCLTENIPSICEADIRKMDSLYISHGNFPSKIEATQQSCYCDVTANQDKSSVSIVAISMVTMCTEERLQIVRDENPPLYDSCRTTIGQQQILNTPLLNATVSDKRILTINFDKTDDISYESRFILHLEASAPMDMTCSGSSIIASNTTTQGIPSTIEETTLHTTLYASTSTAAPITTQSTTVVDATSTQFEASSAGSTDDKTSLKIGLSVFAVILVAAGVTVGVIFYRRRLQNEQPPHDTQEHVITPSEENPQPSGEELASDILTEEDISLGEYLHTCLASGENKSTRDLSNKSYSYEYVDVELHQKALPIHGTPKACRSHNPQGSSDKNRPEVQIHPFQQQDSIKYEDVELQGDTFIMQNYDTDYEDTSTKPVSEAKYEHLEIPGGDDLDQPTLYESVHLESRAGLG